MEPFRPVIDREVHRLKSDGIVDVTGDAKVALARTMIIDLPTAEGLSPLIVCLERLASSLAKAYAGETDRLILPKPGLPLGF
jgi:CRISPR-associated protein Cas1